jgi:hypothetical protein
MRRIELHPGHVACTTCAMLLTSAACRSPRLCCERLAQTFCSTYLLDGPPAPLYPIMKTVLNAKPFPELFPKILRFSQNQLSPSGFQCCQVQSGSVES